MSSILKRSQFSHWDTMTKVNVSTCGSMPNCHTHWSLRVRQPLLKILRWIVRISLDLVSLHRDAAMVLCATWEIDFSYAQNKLNLLHSLMIFLKILAVRTTIVAKLTAFLHHQIYAVYY